MPYIPQAERVRYGDAINALPVPASAGELNYVLTRIFIEFWHANGQNYQAFNDILGASEGAKLELCCRQIARYEDRKCLQNGDVG